MSAPQFIFVAWMAMALGVALSDHGKPKKGTENFFYTAVGIAVLTLLVWWGGFFDGGAR